MSLQLVSARLLQALVVLIGVSTLVFALVRIIPGDPVRLMIGEQATEEQVRAARAEFHLDRPIWQQYLYYMSDVLRGEMGESLRQRQPVVKLVLESFPATAQLALVALGIGVVVGIPIGILSAVRRGTALDNGLMLITLVGQALPTFWWGIVLIIVFAVSLRLLPTSGAGTPQQLILPAVTLATYITALITRLTRSALLEVLEQDYIRSAWAKGLPGRSVIWVHALKNAAIPIATVIGLQFGNLLGGAVITETVFAWPGIGRLAVNAIYNRDYPLVQAIVLLAAVVVLTINTIIDLLYIYLDPRIRYR